MVALGASKKVEEEKKEVQKKVEEEIKKITSNEAVEDSDFGAVEIDEDKKQQILDALKSGNMSEAQAMELESLIQKGTSMLEKAKDGA